MKSRKFKIILTAVFIFTASCNEPRTVVTNIIHPDGSITRKIEMKNMENKFEISDIQVPFDSTWLVKDSLEIDENNDTVWVKRAEKLFRNVAEINRDYETDSGANREVSRNANLRKSFRWFHTGYRFAETVNKKMIHGYPIADFLNQDELTWFYSPEDVKDRKINSPDSLQFRSLDDTVDAKTDKWIFRSIISEWIVEFTKLTGTEAGKDLSADSLKAREGEFARLIMANEEQFDSLWKSGIFLKEFLGETNAIKYQEEADSAINVVTNNFWVSFSDYTVKIMMPGKITGTNGFIDSTRVLLWPVKSDYFLTEPYEMWAESKVPNWWAWIVSGLFVVSVFTGIIFTRKGKG